MDSILLASQSPASFTAVSNVFIDDYMPHAHGDYVKVYLYLLRCLGEDKREISISFLADRFEDTEKDILRAIRYWEQKRLLKLDYDEKGSITCISLSVPPSQEQIIMPAPIPASLPVQMTVQTPILESQNQGQSQNQRETEEAEAANTSAVITRPVYTAEQIACIKEYPEVVLLLEQIEQALQRLLKPNDIQLILYLYEGLGFSTQLILYLYEYCISINKAHIHYVERVAINWHRDKINTIEQAKAATKQYKQYNREYGIIAKALGFQRSLAEPESEFVKKWLSLGFPTEVILDAFKRTILQIQTPSFPYANKILEGWHNAGIHTMEEMKAINDTVSKPSAEKLKPLQTFGSSYVSSGYQRSKNRFTSFEQHNYSKEDMDLIERALLRNSESIIKKGDLHEPYE